MNRRPRRPGRGRPGYSRAHFDAVSPLPDTPEQVAWRLRDNLARELAHQDTRREFPHLGPDNIRAALDYQEQRIRFHHAELSQ